MNSMRFSPSPTGSIHIANARVALLNYIKAQDLGYKFILRVDDTDIQRNQEKGIENIINDLTWLGIQWNDLIYQSARLDLYGEVLKSISGVELVNNRYVVFLEQKKITWYDNNFGQQTTQLPPHIALMRESGYPLYNFCSIVDDIDLKTKLIIRGADHITNTGIQLYLRNLISPDYDLEFLHVPMVVNSSGLPLSKRDIETASIRNLRCSGFDANAINSLIMCMNADTVKIYTDIKAINADDIKATRSSVIYNHNQLVSLQGKLIKNYKYNAIAAKVNNIGLKLWNLISANSDTWRDVDFWIDVFQSDTISVDLLDINDAARSVLMQIANSPREWKTIIAKAPYIKLLRLILTNRSTGPNLGDIIDNLSDAQISARILECCDLKSI